MQFSFIFLYFRDTMDNLLSGRDALALVEAIENGNEEQLKTVLSNLPGKNISDLLVTTTWPKGWNHDARTIKSTPLRTAIAYKNTKALDAILDSECIVTTVDLSVGLQHILRHIESESELYILRQLVRNGAEVDNPACFNLVFKKLILQGEMDRCKQVVTVICQSHPNNALLGMLLLSVCKEAITNQNEQDDGVINVEAKWRELSLYTMREIMETSFSPKEFLSDMKMWLSMGNTSFQRLVHALPLLIQTITRCDIEALGWLLRYLARAYGFMWAEGRAKLCELPQLMWAAGINFQRLMSIACLSPCFLHETGFSNSLKQGRIVSTLQHLCRISIRCHLTAGNVYSAMKQLDCIPAVTRDFILLKDLQPLPWESQNEVRQCFQ